MLKTLIKALGLAVGGLAALKLAVVYFEPKLAFHPARGLSLTPSDLGLDFREHLIDTSDGETVVAWHVPHPQPRAQVVYFHGNAGNLSTWVEFLQSFHSQGYSVTALDYRGYGDSTGSPSEPGLYRDVEAFLKRYREEIYQDGPPVIFWGRSLGGPVAAYAASLHEPHGLVLEVTFPNKDSLIEDNWLFRILGPLARFEFDTVGHLSGRTCPVLVIHGDQDFVVPLKQGQRLFEALRPPKQFYLVEGAQHNDTQVVDPLYWQQVEGFISGLSAASEVSPLRQESQGQGR
ncbi:MAG TPA: alpha/beta hydrolase [Acidobacteriota bacterium]|nr:alpha/beta hydrolase [Acidobacteriota bacterium]